MRIGSQFARETIARMCRFNQTDPAASERRNEVIKRFARLLNQRAKREVMEESRYTPLCQEAWEELRREFGCVVYYGIHRDKARPRDEQEFFLFAVLTPKGWDQRSFRVFTGGTSPKFCY